MSVIRKHKPFWIRRNPCRHPAAVMLAVALLVMIGCSSGNKANTGSGPNLLRAVILQPAADTSITKGTAAEPTSLKFSGIHAGGNTETVTPGYTWSWVEPHVGPRTVNDKEMTVQFDDDDTGQYVFTFTVRDVDGYVASTSVRVNVVGARF